MSNGTCPFLHAGPYPACPYTYAEILGSSYDNINIIYAIIVIIISTLTFASVAIIVKRRKFTPLDTQKRMFYLSTGLCITLMIRSIEPAGYRLWLPYTLSGLCVDWGSCFLYSLVFTLIHDWIRIVMKITGKQELVKPTEYFFYFLNGFIWILMTVFSVLQSNDDRYYAWRGTKLTVAGTAAALIVILQSYFGWVIFRTLRANEVLHTRTKSQLASPRTKRLESQSTSSSINKPAKPEKLSAGKRSKINRIKYLLILYGVCESIVCIAQFVTASTVVKDRYTLSSPPAPPTGAMDVLTESLFDWAHMLAVALLLVFFHPPLRAENENAKPDDRDDGRSEMRNNERAAQSQGSDKSSKKLSNLEEADENLSGAAADSNNSGDLHIVVSDAGSSGSVRQPLPDGWQELVNEQGVPYYYNARENVTVWERPGGHSIDERSPKETDKLHYGGSSSANPSLSF